MAMEARKPIFDLKAADGALGAHSYAAKRCFEDFENLASAILESASLTGAWDEDSHGKTSPDREATRIPVSHRVEIGAI